VQRTSRKPRLLGGERHDLLDFIKVGRALPELAHRGQGVSKEVFVYLWRILHVRCQYLCMSTKVNDERITCPSPFDFDHIEWNVTEKIFEGSPNPDSVSL